MPTWNSELYLQFDQERTRPSIDLLARIQLPCEDERPPLIVDLGCGPGNSTQVLRGRWPEAEIIGVDNSPQMIEAAKRSYPHEEWHQADIANWSSPLPFDLVFANAVLHWLPNHGRLLPRLLGCVAPRGVLAFQIPNNDAAPLRQVVLEVANDGLWRDRLEECSYAQTREEPANYYDILQPLCSRVEIWETTYYHIMNSAHSILDWYRATGLRPYLEALPTDDQRTAFQERVLEGYTRAYPHRPDGRVLFPFKRLFVIAAR